MSILAPVEVDIYNGVLADLALMPEVGKLTPGEFAVVLENSLTAWRNDKRRGIWIKVPKEYTQFVQVITNAGFDFHHTQKTYIMLCTWVGSGPNRLPEYATSYIGVGGFVVNDKNEVLCICEKYETLNRWKIPGGLVDRGEDIATAAVREVFEETGIECEFEGIVCFRHLTKYLFGMSDLYFVCKLKPLTSKITMQEEEIAKCEWIPFEIYKNNPTSLQMHREICAIAAQSMEDGWKSDFGMHLIPSHFHNQKFYYPTENEGEFHKLYHPKKEEK